MDSSDIAIEVENISKCYRIGLKEKIDDSLVKTVVNFIKSPLDNYRKYRALYKLSASSWYHYQGKDRVNESAIILEYPGFTR